MNFLPQRRLMIRRTFTLTSTLSKFEIDFYNNTATANANVLLRFKFNGPGGAMFRINQATHYQVLMGFKKALDWFYDPNKADLFVVNEKNQLTFNNDYNNLIVTIHSSQIYNEHMEIRPCVNNSDSDRGHEGVIIFLNSASSYIIINREELEEIYTLLSNFSYQAEIDLLVKVDMLATKMKIQQPM